jgi:integrase
MTGTPFHRFGVTIKVKEETKCDSRIGLQEEQTLLAAGCEMGGPEHKFVGPIMHDRIIGALETCCRRGEMLRIQNRHVDWERHQIAIPAGTRRMRRTAAFPSIHKDEWRRFSSA